MRGHCRTRLARASAVGESECKGGRYHLHYLVSPGVFASAGAVGGGQRSSLSLWELSVDSGAFGISAGAMSALRSRRRGKQVPRALILQIPGRAAGSVDGGLCSGIGDRGLVIGLGCIGKSSLAKNKQGGFYLAWVTGCLGQCSSSAQL